MNNPITQSSNNPINEKMKNGKIYDIHERIYKWVIDVINYTKKIPKTPQNLVIVPQIVASVTSVGANDQEADASDSKKDFIAKYAIVRKECKETIYWLKILRDTNTSEFRQEAERLITEGKEISYIVSTIMKNAKR